MNRLGQICFNSRLKWVESEFSLQKNPVRLQKSQFRKVKCQNSEDNWKKNYLDKSQVSNELLFELRHILVFYFHMNQSWVFIFSDYSRRRNIPRNAVDPNSRYYNKTRSDWELRVSTTFNIVWPAPFYRGSSAGRLAVTGPEARLEAIDPAGPGRAVQFNCDAIYGVHFDTGSSLHSCHWRSCTEGADWSPVCSRDWGISGGCRILVTKSLNRWVWCLFSNYRKSIGFNETAITPR